MLPINQTINLEKNISPSTPDKLRLPFLPFLKKITNSLAITAQQPNKHTKEAHKHSFPLHLLPNANPLGPLSFNPRALSTRRFFLFYIKKKQNFKNICPFRKISKIYPGRPMGGRQAPRATGPPPLGRRALPLLYKHSTPIPSSFEPKNTSKFVNSQQHSNTKAHCIPNVWRWV